MHLEDIESTLFHKLIRVFGLSEYHEHTPYLSIEEGDAYGYYDHEDNEIILCEKAFDSEEDLLRTLAHEWMHYLQDPNKLCKKEFINELEKQAEEAEELWKQLK